MKNICYKCILNMTHPWHDDGTPNSKDMKHFLGIDWFQEEREGREGRIGNAR
jgi:hypothetical protein